MNTDFHEIADDTFDFISSIFKRVELRLGDIISSQNMVRVSISVCLLLILFCKISAAKWNNTIFVSPSGSNNISCGSASDPCQTLDFVFGLGVSNSTRIQLDAGDYSLNRTYSFRWLQDFAITGNESKAEDVTIECSPNASLGFVLSDRIILENFVFHRCGGWHQSTQIITTSAKKAFVKFRTALYLNYCTDVKISGVHVLRSPGLAITLYDIGGVLNLENCNFTENMPVADNINISQTLSEGHAIAGGGAFLELTREGSNLLSRPDKHHTLQTSNNSYSFLNCHFVRNKTPPPKQANHSFLVASFISGGGLGISFESNASNNNIDIHSCEFIGNEAGWGGGIHVDLLGPSSNNSINISGTTFENNRAVVAGGGIRFSANNSMVTKLQLPHHGFFENCTFHNNTAIWGGGFSVFGTTQQVPAGTYIPHHLDNVHFKHCRWTKNNATVGSAVGAFLDNLNANGIGPLVPYSLLFEHCSVVGNGLRLSSSVVQGITLGLGAIYSIQVPISFTGNTTIANNTQTSLALDSATVSIRDKVIFKNNSGYRGGALTLHGRSSVVFYEESELDFTENHCESSGGAIYVAAQGSPFVSLAQASGTNLHPCFFLYERRYIHPNDWKTKIVFRGNVATSNKSGNSIYASTLSNCRHPGELRSNNSVLQWRIISFMDIHGNPVNETGEVSTDPIDIKIRDDDWIKAPGEVFDASLTLTDETGHSVDGIVHVSVEGINSSAKLGTPPMFLASAESGRLQNIKIDGKEDDQFNVKLMTFIGPLVQRQINNVKLTRCNPGFHSKGNDVICSCNKGLPDQFGIANCSTNGRDVYIKRGYWAGFVGTEFVSYPCPNDYCKPCKNLTMLYRKGDMCSSDRDQSSILCGSCKQGYSVELGSSRCSKNCNNLYLLLIIPYGIGLLLLVMLIMLINLDAFTGYLNAWLYSYQVMILLKKDEMKFDKIVHFIIGLSELQIKLDGKGLCLAEHLHEVDVLFISYSVPAYVLLLVVILARIVRRYPRWLFSRKVRAPFRALCTIFVLCYTTITGISLKILHFVHIGGRFVLYQDGENQFFNDNRHKWYGTIAILNIIFIVIPVPLFLMFTPFFVRKAHQYFHINLNTFKPMYDTLQSCFKDKYRWFSAFYFVCRFLLLILATFAPFGPVKRCLIEISCIFILAIFLYFRPYKQAEPAEANHQNPEEEDFDWINKSDAVLLTNLCFIAVVSSAFEDENKAVMKVVDILAYVPLLVLIVVLGRATGKYVSSAAAITRGSRSTTTLIDTSTTGSSPDP